MMWDAAATGSHPKDESEPLLKKGCFIATPDSEAFNGPQSCVVSSTPLPKSAKKLFNYVEPVLVYSGFSEEFLPSLFINHIEKLRRSCKIMENIKKTVTSHVYDKRTRSLTVEFNSTIVCDKMSETAVNFGGTNITVMRPSGSKKESLMMEEIGVAGLDKLNDNVDSTAAQPVDMDASVIFSAAPVRRPRKRPLSTPATNLIPVEFVKSTSLLNEENYAARNNQVVSNTDDDFHEKSVGAAFKYTPSEGSLTSKVKVTGIPLAHYLPELLLMEINKYFWSKDVERIGVAVAVSIVLDEDDQTKGVVQFISVADAQDACDNGEFCYLNHNNKLQLSQIREKPPLLTYSKAADGLPSNGVNFLDDVRENSVSASFNCTLSEGSLTSKAEVTGIPSANFLPELLLMEINKYFWSKDVERIGVAVALSVVVDDYDVTKGVVEFISVADAEDACNNGSFTYLNKSVHLTQIREEPSAAPLSSKAAVTGLPLSNFLPELLLMEFNKYFWSKDVERIGVAVALSVVVDDYDVTKGVVEFVSVADAEDACSNGSFTYLNKSVHLTQIREEPSAAPLSSKAAVTGLPLSNFLPELLLMEINKFFWSKDVERIGVAVALSVVVDDYDVTKGVVEFVSVADAEDACNNGSFTYLNNSVHLTQIREEPVLSLLPNKPLNYYTKSTLKLVPVNLSSSFPDTKNDSCTNLSLQESGEQDPDQRRKHSCYVRFRNINPSDFSQDEFKKFVINTMKDAKFIADDVEGVITNIFNPQPLSNSVVVQFSCPEEAYLASLLQAVQYKGKNLEMLRIEKDDVSKDSLTENDDSTFTDMPAILTLKDEDGKDHLLRALVKSRENFPTNGPHEEAIRTVQKLVHKENVIASCAEIRKKRATFRDAYNKQKANTVKPNRFFNVYSVIFDNADINILKGTKYEVSMDNSVSDFNSTIMDNGMNNEDLDSLIKLSGASTWTNDATKAFIGVCIDCKPLYDKGKRDNFWLTVSRTLARQKYMHMPKRCQKRFEALTAEYRNYSQEAERTGAEGPLEMIKSSETRKIMALMGEFWCNSVSIKPKVTIAAGVKAVTHHTEKQPSPTGRVRKLPSKKTDTRAERLLKCEEEKSGALKLMSESIALMMQNKRNQ